MEQSEATQKAIRLCELIAEAKQIISELEDYATTKKYAEFKDINLKTLPMPEGPLKTRFINSVCYCGNLESLQDLLLTPVATAKKFRNMGKKSLELAQQVIKENYGVEWK